MRRCGVHLLHWALIAALAASAPLSARADAVGDLCASVVGDPSVKVRIVSAVSLGKIHDRRAVPSLERALHDPDPTVRGAAAASLGQIGDPGAIPALRQCARDPNHFVRDQAKAALAVLAPPPAAGGSFVAIREMGNRTRHGGRAYARKLHDFLVAELAHTPHVTLTPGSGSRGAYTLEGSITDLHREAHGDYVDVSCTVSLVVGRYPDGAIVMMTSGDATVEVPRGNFSAAQEPAMQVDALRSAVEGANQNLAAFFASR